MDKEARRSVNTLTPRMTDGCFARKSRSLEITALSLGFLFSKSFKEWLEDFPERLKERTKEVGAEVHRLGTEADFKFPEVNARSPSWEPVGSGSDTDRDEARMAAEMVGGRTWLEGEWFATESEPAGHQGGVLEPAVSAALDFKAMLKAALRGPSFLYDGGIRPNLENAHEQHSYVDTALTFAAHDTDSNIPRTRFSPEEIKLDSDLSTKHGQTPAEHNMQYQNQELASEVLGELERTLLLQPPPFPMPPAFNRNNYAHVTGSMGPQSPSISTPIFTPSPLDPHIELDGEPDIGLDELLDILQEDPAAALEKYQAASTSNKEMDVDGTTLALGPPSWHQEPEIAPHTPAVPEGPYSTMLAPSSNEVTQDRYWLHDLNRSGEGVEDTSEEVISFENGERYTNQILYEPLNLDDEDLDFERLRQNDGSVLASNWTYPEGVSPEVSRPSRSNSSSPVVIMDSYNMSRNEDRISSPLERNSIVGNPRASSIPRGNPIVDLTSDDSDGDEEESELREIDGMSRGKRKLPSWAGERKWPRESADRSHLQPSGHHYASLAHRYAHLASKAGEMSLVSSRSRSCDPSPLRYSSATVNGDSSVTSASHMRVMSGAELQRRATGYRVDSYPASEFIRAQMAQRTSPGEVSTSYDTGAGRVLPGSMSSFAGLRNGMRLAAVADQRLHVVVDPVKRSEELATQVVFQAFALGDEQEETSPDEELLTLTLLKHQRIALSWMVHRESGRNGPCGGILADDQGLGKTISTISLILKNRAPVRKSDSSGSGVETSTVDLDGDEEEGRPLASERKVDAGQWSSLTIVENGSAQQGEDGRAIRSSGKGRPAAGTLVVCPTSVLRQWAQEIRDKVAAAADLTVLVYHGSNRIKDPQEIARYDVVLSTFSIVSMEVPKPPTEEKEEEKRNGSEYGFVGLPKAKKEKAEKAKKGKGKSRGEGTDGDGSISPDAGPLARVAWFRVVLDEAQSIKNHRTQVARAAWGLRAKRRWCLSGTPIQNSIDDLYSYFRFLRYAPWDVYKKFQQDIKEPINRNPNEGYKKLQAILKPIVLRRTKTSFIDGKPIVNLPPRIVNLQQSEFSLEERSFYSNLEADSRAQFQVYAAAGTVQNNYVNILWMLLRLRQACDHPMLVKKCHKSEAFHKTTLEAVRKLPPPQRAQLIQCLEGGRTICHICQDAPEEPVVSICGHVFCRQCISEQMGNGDDTTCRFPKCRKGLNSSLLFTLAALKNPALGGVCGSVEDGETGVVSGGAEVEPNWNTSSKIDAVINTLQALPKLSVLVEDGKIVKGPKAEKLLKSETLEVKESEGLGSVLTVASESSGSTVEKVDSTEKAIVFSQWTSMLDLLEVPLKDAGFCYRRLDGTMSVVARDRAVSDFNTLPEVTVMIMSLKAASLGLNMVAASHVLLLDVWWNPTTEDQAIDRAHRIGQTRTVNVSRFTVKNTIEDRILALQERKRQIVASAFGENGGGEKGSRLTTEDLRYLFRM